jgi:hypothetical protein
VKETSEIPAPPDYVANARTYEERRAAAEDLRRIEHQLAVQLEHERELLRQHKLRQRSEPQKVEPPPSVAASTSMFMTMRQKRQLLTSQQE